MGVEEGMAMSERRAREPPVENVMAALGAQE